MRSHGWLVLGILALPAFGCARPLKESDLVGGWRIQQAQFGYTLQGQENAVQAQQEPVRGWLVLWPDHLWVAAGRGFMGHGGSRWRLVGDTLWLAYDWLGYFHGVLEGRAMALLAEGAGVGATDRDIARRVRPTAHPDPRSVDLIPDSVFWSPAFRDTTRFCEGGVRCTTWVFKVTRNKDSTLSLARIEALTRMSPGGATAVRLKRDSFPIDECLRMVDTTKLGPTPPFRTRREWINGHAWGPLFYNGCR